MFLVVRGVMYSSWLFVLLCNVLLCDDLSNGVIYNDFLK